MMVVGRRHQLLISIAGLLVANVASNKVGLQAASFSSEGDLSFFARATETLSKMVRREPESKPESLAEGEDWVQVGSKVAVAGPPIVIGSAELAEKSVRTVEVSVNDESGHPLIAHWHLSNVENNANTFTKSSGAAEYDAEALTEHKNVMSLKVRPKQTDKAFRIGLTSNEFDHADFEHGFFLGFYDRGRLYVPDWTVSGYN